MLCRCNIVRCASLRLVLPMYWNLLSGENVGYNLTIAIYAMSDLKLSFVDVMHISCKVECSGTL